MGMGIVLRPNSVEGAVGDENPLPTGKDYTTKIEWSGGNPIYVGEAVPGTLVTEAKWRIKKITWDGDGNPTDIKWADSVKTFTKVWNSRGDYTYA